MNRSEIFIFLNNFIEQLLLFIHSFNNIIIIFENIINFFNFISKDLNFSSEQIIQIEDIIYKFNFKIIYYIN